ncbi:MAG: polyprenol monophosphomannose synthase [Acidobacteria bacterium]|nr:polyprenol monophosphomannose synthase [Acidobacteriota bacterium]
MRTVVVIPTYNERANLPRLVDALLRTPGLQILVVDDGSPDGTGDAADAMAVATAGRVSVLRRTGPRGLGLSYIEGMQHALRLHAEAICQMDADFSHDPADVPRLVAALATADVAIGSRYVPGGRVENWSTRRVLLSAFANQYVRAITGLPIRDCTSGFRCWRREALERLALPRIRSNGYAFQVEMAWYATALGCRIVEIPITFTERREGVSKLSARVVAESVLLPWRLAGRRPPRGAR